MTTNCYNTGIEFTAVTRKYYVPDAGAPVAFLGVGLLAIAGLRRSLQR